MIKMLCLIKIEVQFSETLWGLWRVCGTPWDRHHGLHSVCFILHVRASWQSHHTDWISSKFMRCHNNFVFCFPFIFFIYILIQRNWFAHFNVNNQLYQISYLKFYIFGTCRYNVNCSKIRVKFIYIIKCQSFFNMII